MNADYPAKSSSKILINLMQELRDSYKYLRQLKQKESIRVLSRLSSFKDTIFLEKQNERSVKFEIQKIQRHQTISIQTRNLKSLNITKSYINFRDQHAYVEIATSKTKASNSVLDSLIFNNNCQIVYIK